MKVRYRDLQHNRLNQFPTRSRTLAVPFILAIALTVSSTMTAPDHDAKTALTVL